MSIEKPNKPVLTEEDLEYICDSVCRYPAIRTESEMEKYCDECIITKKLKGRDKPQEYEKDGIKIVAEIPPKKCAECLFCVYVCKETDTETKRGCFLTGTMLNESEKSVAESCPICNNRKTRTKEGDEHYGKEGNQERN